MEPGSDLIAAEIGNLAQRVSALQDELVVAEKLRSAKIEALRRLMYVVVPAVVLLLIMAITNFVLINKTTSLSDTIAGCLKPRTECSEANRRAQADQLDRIRQTQFVIAICQRRNPVDKDPNGDGVVTCIQSYYPGFLLPEKVEPTP